MRFLLFLLLAVTCSAQLILRDPAAFARYAVAPTASWTPCTGCFLTEYFNATGYDGAWVESVDSYFDPDSSLAAEGAQSLGVNIGANFNATTTNFAAKTEAWIKFAFRVSDSAGNPRVMLTDAGDSSVWEMRVITTDSNKVRVYNATTESTSSTTALSLNTWYTVWGYYNKGTGANGISRLWLAPLGSSKPVSPECEIVNGVSVWDASKVACGFLVGSIYNVDALELKATAFE